MTPKRWKHVSRVFKSAIERGRAERAAFLDAACAGDENLRREVEALVSAHERAESDGFIDAPAAGLAAELLTGEGAGLRAGQTVGHYEVLEKLGEGGMGEVYLARDTVLERQAALKILPPDVVSDRQRMQRFEQEARAASALNHPNIITVYEVGKLATLHFIATEYVQGMTLRERAARGKLEPAEVLDIAVQTASALAAAHEAGIVHRDIKPDNIMLRPDGYVKILDFGIAKLSEKAKGLTTDAEAQTAPLLRTAPGLLLGTVSYMSPEQARGREVDARTDVWSLGVVLYELLAGRAPFSGETHSDIISLVLQRDPVPLRHLAPEVPEELQRIVSKALTKDRDLRYQSARDMQIDLQRLKRQMEFEAELERSTPPHLNTKASAAVEEKATAKKRRALPVAFVIFLALVVIVAGLLLWRSKQRQTEAFPAASTEAAPAAIAAPERRLSYWLTVQKYRNNRPYEDPFRLSGEINFEKDYRIRLHVTSQQSGYLYVINEGPEEGSVSAPFNILFPSPTANDGSALLSEGQKIQLPEQSWFSFDAAKGTEKLWLIWSGSSVAELEAVKKFANPKDGGAVNDPALSRQVGEYLKARSAPKPNVEKDDEQKQTTVNAKGEVLVHLVNLEHH